MRTGWSVAGRCAALAGGVLSAAFILGNEAVWFYWLLFGMGVPDVVAVMATLIGHLVAVISCLWVVLSWLEDRAIEKARGGRQ